MPCRSACPRSALLQQLPLRPLNRLSPKRLLSRFSSLEPYLCLTHSFSALPPEHRLDGAFPNRWTRAKRRGDRPAVGCAVPFYRSDRPRSPGPPPPNGIVFRFYPAPPLSGAAPFRRRPFPAQLRRLSGPSNAAARPFSAAFCAAAECDKNPVRAYGILYRTADAKEDGAHPLFGVRAVLWRKRGEKR